MNRNAPEQMAKVRLLSLSKLATDKSFGVGSGRIGSLMIVEVQLRGKMDEVVVAWAHEPAQAGNAGAAPAA